jgi:predicted HNH restriction endonuclease
LGRISFRKEITRRGDDDAVTVRTTARRATAPSIDDFELQDPAELEMDEEGRRILREHLHSERSARLVAAFKRGLQYFKCSACDLDFQKVYGQLGHRYIECHHTQPISEMLPGEATKISDLVPLCANCHRMVHRSSPMKSVAQLKEILATQFSASHEF